MGGLTIAALGSSALSLLQSIAKIVLKLVLLVVVGWLSGGCWAHIGCLLGGCLVVVGRILGGCLVFVGCLKGLFMVL